jgi:Ser/Thr protein kinase RdoA (MazF antagonist)
MAPYNHVPILYHEAIKVLRRFHNAVYTTEAASAFLPFGWILQSPLKTHQDAPEELTKVFARTRILREKLRPWLRQNAVVCHGDFHTKNILLDSRETSIRPLIIDFDAASFGHPFYDVAQFSYGLEIDQRIALLQTYLNKSALTEEEKEHFGIVANACVAVNAMIQLEDLFLREQLASPKNQEAEKQKNNAIADLKTFLEITQSYEQK